MPITAAQSIAHSTFFKLPSELRNRVYELALTADPFVCNVIDISAPDKFTMTKSIVSPGKVTIRKETGIPEPALLTACKTVRLEAIGIFYSPDVNEMRLIIDSFHPAMAVLWNRKNKALSEQYGLPADIRASSWNEGTRNWENLTLWLLEEHQDTADWARDGLYECIEWGVAKLIHSLFLMVAAMRDRPWSDVLPVLDEFQPVLRYLHSDWKRVDDDE